MTTYIVEINGERFVVHAYTVDEAEWLALQQFEGLVTSVVVSIAEDNGG